MPRPNIVLILLDDLGWRDLSCYGSTFYETPNIDRLAAEGVRFTNAYAACPVCSPTRASLMTGRYPARLGLTNYIPGVEKGMLLSAPFVHYLPLEEKTVADALREGGYATWHVGKWHLGKEAYWPEHHGFDVNVAGCDWGGPRHGYFSPWGHPRLADGPNGEYLDDRLTTEAIGLIRSRDRRKPFFLNFCFHLVHIPVQPKPDLNDKYAAKSAALGLAGKDPFEIGEPFPCEHKRHLRVIRRTFQSDPGYAAMVQTADDNVGRLLAALEDEGIAGETIVMFTSDNGGLATAEGSPTCNAPLAEGKGWMYEGGTRDPLIVRWPGATSRGVETAATVTSPDFFPTMLEMAGLPPRCELHVDGVSFASVLTGGRAPERGPIFWHFPHYANQGGTPGCSVVAGDWKLIEFFEGNRIELYHLKDDLSEERNVADARPEIARELRERLRVWLAGIGARMPRPNPDWTAAEGA